MSSRGAFISGAIAGVVVLGVASWLLATFSDNEASQEEPEKEEE
ncbi:MAG: hypothetical protein PUK52_04610 [Desulfovibrio sp.]|nr:hypothetical protein [Desulfovibrio sp.]